MKTDAEDAAFPQNFIIPPNSMNPQGYKPGAVIVPGLTKREWLAGMALQGIIAGWGDGPFKPEVFADRAERMADALIAKLNEKEGV